MTFKELFNEKEFQEVFAEIEKFSHDKLDKYIKQLKEQKLSSEGKEIFDAVWGNIEFSSGEIYILDSPLLQRLRGIKQLGLAYFVYCGCDYSRFYHTLGVTYLANRMADAINRCDIVSDDEEKAYFKAVVRLAAIFHDVGHMFYSHASEHYFGKNRFYPRYAETIEPMMDEAKMKTKKDNIALHELLSCMIVNTTAVQNLLECVQNQFDVTLVNNNHDIEDLIEYISSLILGVPVDGNILPYAKIINGPIDADMCDYLSRDSHVTKVPVAVDIARLTQKLSVVEDEITMSDVWHDNGSGKKPFYIMAMKDSAEKALFQLCIARTIMYDSVYYHHKVLTAETEFRDIINRLANLEKPLFNSFYEILQLSDGDFNDYFFDSLKRERGKADCAKIDQISEELHDLYRRNLAKRVACLMPEYIDGSQAKSEDLFDNVLTKIDSPEERQLIEAIKKEYIYLENKVNKKDIDPEKIKICVIHTPTIVFGHSKVQIPIDLRNGNKREFKGYELVSSRETSSSASYIVTNVNNRMLMLIALQKIFVQQYGIKITDEGLACGKYDQKELTKICRKLYEDGYFDNTPQLISDELLYNVITKKKIEDLVKKFSSYEGPDGYRVTEDAVKIFVKQIMAGSRETDNYRSIVDGIFRMLDNALFIDRMYLSKHLDKLLLQISESQEKLYVVPLGNSRDSAKHMMYFWNDKKSAINVETEKSLEQLLKEPEVQQIVFFDDGSFSGTQLLSIMQEYLGEKKETKEHHVEELTEELKTVFRQKKIVFFFVAFNSSQEKELRNKLEKIGLTKIQFKYIEDMSTGMFKDDTNSIFDGKKQKDAVEEFLSKVGYSVMKSKKMIEGVYKENWDEKRVREAALGYNNAQQMVFLKSSVPTYTIVAFWQSGEVREMHWKALFKRTEKE